MGYEKKVIAFLCVLVMGITSTGITMNAQDNKVLVTDGGETDIATELASDTVVYVSLNGKEGAAGTLQDPFPSIEEARDYLRTKNLDALNRGTVYIREGVYRVSNDNPTVELGAEDSYVTYAAYRKEEVKITGTVTLQNNNFKKLSEVTGEAYSSQERLPDEIKDQIYVYPLGEEGIPVGKIYKNGFNWKKQPFQPELIVDGVLQALAQYPNSGVMKQDMILAGKTKDGTGEDQTAKAAGANEGDRPRNYIFDKTDNPKTYEEMLAMRGPIFYTRNGLETRIAAWAPPTQEGEPQADQPDVHPRTDNTLYETDGWLSGYFENDYANDMVRIYSVDTVKQVIHCKYPSLQGVQDKRIQLKAMNLLCELDSKGEYYIDRFNNNDVLYYYPKDGNIAGKEVELTSSDEPFFVLNGASEVVIRGIEMSGGTGHGITMMNCESCTITDCEFSNLGLDAIKIGQNNSTITTDPSYTTSGGGHNNIVRNCKFHDLGCGGVYLAGGNEQTLEHGNNLVEHCEFYNISRLQTYTPAVYLEGAGNTAQYNYIHDAPHMVIQIMGNDMLVSHNKFINVCQNTSDQGAIYSGRCFTWLGNEISYNYFNNIKSGTYAIYMDDGMSGMIIHHNIFEKIAGSAIFSNSGFGHQIYSNIMLNATTGVIYKAYSGSRPIANEKVLRFRYNKVLSSGDEINNSNTQKNIDHWYSHYKDLYPYINERFFPEENDSTWITDTDSVFVPSHQRLQNTIMIGTSSNMNVGSVSALQDSEFNTGNYFSASSEKLGLDMQTGKISLLSPLKDIKAYGKEWIQNWNAGYTLEGIGPVETQIPDEIMTGDVNQNGKIDANDALEVLRYTVQLNSLTGDRLAVADVDKDSQITTNDALIILKYIVGKIQDFAQI